MNARLYDPMLHRFLQHDNYIQHPTNTQNFNQYGYVLNNPLKYTDPSGNKFKLTFSHIVAGLEIVAGAIMVAASSVTYGATYIAGASLIAAGAGHFAVTAVEYSQTKDWVSASNNAGLTFGIKFDTDFGYDGAKPDVSSNKYSNSDIPLIDRFNKENVDPNGRPDLSLKGVLNLNKNVQGLGNAYLAGGKSNIRFDITSNKYVGLTEFDDVNLNPTKITTNLKFAAVLFHEYRHAWQYNSGNYYYWQKEFGYSATENYMERDAYWYQIQMGTGSFFDGYNRYSHYSFLTEDITYK